MSEILLTDSLITGPSVEPLDLEEVKKARRFTSTSLDTLFDLWIAASRGHFEEQTGRQLITAVWEVWLNGWPDGEIELPHPPLQSVESITGVDSDGTETVMDVSSYYVMAPGGPYARRGRVGLVSGATWPTAGRLLKIRYRAGYGDAPGDVPELVKGALHLLIGHFHKNGEETTEKAMSMLPMGAKLIIDGFKYSAYPTVCHRTTSWV